MLPFVWNSSTPHDYLEPNIPETSAEEGRFIQELTATRAFRRLRSIHFLGAIDYTLVPVPNGTHKNVRYTRYQHSLGVLRLAGQYTTYVWMDRRSRLLAFAAALLHDIGHAPLSHSLEPVFKVAFDIDHHRATDNIILGRHPIGSDIPLLLQKAGVDPDEVVAVLSGEVDPCRGFFSGPINFDTIEGILRTAMYVMPSHSRLEPSRVVAAAAARKGAADESVVDAFWLVKDDVYSMIIRSREGVIADCISQAILRRNLHRFSKFDYFRTERSLFAKLPELRLALSMGVQEAIQKLNVTLPDTFTSRSFFVNREVDFLSRRDSERYRQSRSVHPLLLSKGRQDPSAIQHDLLQVRQCP